jgi:hypothetical protein
MNNGLIIDKDDNKFYYLNDKLNREDGPAIESANGSKKWYINGKRHREDGPAVEHSHGSKYWYLNGQEIICKDNEEFLRIVNLIEFL